MLTLSVKDILSQEYSDQHFGANILAIRDGLGDDGTYDEAADTLNIDQIRYPGGSLTERYFDIRDPDDAIKTDYITGEDIDFLPFSEFMQFAEATDRSALIVLPTRHEFGLAADANGDRYASVDEDALRGFIRDTLDGVYGSPKIAGFELGNEYWDSGQMTSVEYGRVASKMATIVKDEITNHPDYQELFTDTEVLVQMGHNYGYAELDSQYDGTPEEQLDQFLADYGLDLDVDVTYSNGEVAWPRLANELLLREFETQEEIDSVDGVVAHLYSRGEDNISSRYFPLNTIKATWLEDNPDLEVKITEWNIRNRDRDPDEDYGLTQAHEMLELLEAMSHVDATGAYIYPVQQHSPASLAGDEDDPQEKISGIFFNMLQDSLPGTRPVVLEGADRYQTEISDGDTEIHSFAGQDKLVFYINSVNATETLETQFDTFDLFTDAASIEAVKLGVAPGDLPGSGNSTPVQTTLAAEDVYQDGILSATLAPQEVLQVTVYSPEYTAIFQQQLDETTMETSGEDTDFGIPMIDQSVEGSDQVEVISESVTDDDDDFGIGALLGALPLLLLALL